MKTGFAAFDDVTNGLRRGGAYLVYGAAGLGKSTFALGFVSEGLVAGESVVLVTSRGSASVMEQAKSCGLDFRAGFENNRLSLFEYPEDIAGNSSRLLDDQRIMEEVRAALAGNTVERVVFTPSRLFCPARRRPSRPIVFAFWPTRSRRWAPRPCILSTFRRDRRKPPRRKPLAHGVIRFEELRDGRRIVPELMPECPVSETVRYEFEPGFGLRAVPDCAHPVVPIGQVRAGRSAPAPALRTQPAAAQTATILVIDPDESESLEIQSLLGPAFRVLRAAGAADGLSP